MVTIPTVLILGAGASRPYGFPSAEELKDEVYTAFGSPGTGGCAYFEKHKPGSTMAFFDFQEALRKSGQPSVDAFLEYRPELVPIGKYAIAYCLMPFEEEGKLFQCDRSRGGDWYPHLFRRLSTASLGTFGQNNLSIITFNYDRSIERFLLTALQNTYGRSCLDCIEALKHISIVHVYGQLSVIAYPDLDRRSNSYLPTREPFTAVEGAAAGLKILHEADPKFDAAHQLLSRANRICFLGFGYHPLNIARLAIAESGSKQIFGTAKGLMGQELKIAQDRVWASLHSRMTFFEGDSLDILRQYLILGDQ